MKLKEKLENLLALYDFSLKSSLSQNFLIDPKIVLRLAQEIEPEKEDLVLEIGCGTGILTHHIAKKAKKVWAVEIDKELCSILRSQLKNLGNLEVINEDITKLDLDKLFYNKNNLKVVGNLPYHITSWLLLYLVRKKWWKMMVFTIQREVADRLLSPPGNKTRGALTVIVSYYADIEKVIDIPPQAFYPAPKVSSTVVRIKSKKEDGAKNEELFLDTVRAGFAARRKTLLNCLTKELSLPRPLVRNILAECEIPEKRRAEQLEVEDFVKISNFLFSSFKKNTTPGEKRGEIFS